MALLIGVAGADAPSIASSASAASMDRGVNPDAAATVIYSLDWDGGSGGWTDSTGVWEVGVPTVGPAAAHSGTNVAGTVLGGNYPLGAHAYFISPEVSLPSATGPGTVWLRYWQWYELYPGDVATVEVSADGGPWAVLGEPHVNSGGGIWSQRLLDLSAYGGQTIQLALHLVDDGVVTWNGIHLVAPGWYIDDLQIEQRALSLPSPETFEGGIADWHASAGQWEVGPPTSVGPGSAHGGSGCAGTVLADSYSLYADSRLVSPPMQLPAAPSAGTLWLRYWQWYELHAGDVGTLEISVAGGPWQAISGPFVNTSGLIWTQHLVDLSAFGGQSVRLAFHLLDDGVVTWNGIHLVAPGWYIDDLQIEQRALSLPSPETFEGGVADWHASAGQWEVGRPASGGPSRGHRSSSCAGTVLAGNYSLYADSRLISPTMQLPATGPTENLWLRYWQWYEFSAGDSGTLEISVGGAPWEAISGPFVNGSGSIWTQHLVELSGYAGQSVRIAFHVVDDGAVTWNGIHLVGPGWYIDDLDLLVEGGTFVSPETFDEGYWRPPVIGNWFADNGVWEVGMPTVGPTRGFDGGHCAATVLAGNYPLTTNSRLVSPPIELPAAPAAGQLWLAFWHWYSLVAGDQATVEISVNGAAWQPMEAPFRGTSGSVWSPVYLDLSSYSGQSVRLAFHLVDDGAVTWNGQHLVAEGWYVDDVAVVEGPVPFNTPEGFENGSRGWHVLGGVWQLGAPTAGPGVPCEGAKCAATALVGSYPLGADARLVTPPLALPLGTPELRFCQWYSIYAGDSALLEISVGGEPWQALGASLEGSSPDWHEATVDLSAYAGQTVRLAFHLTDDGAATWNGIPLVAPGWYIDNVRLEGVAMGGSPAPELLSIEYSPSAPQLTWVNPGGAFDHVAVYASRDPDFVPDLGSRIALLPPTTTSFADVVRPGWNHYYRVGTVRLLDGLWRDSIPVGPTIMTGVDDVPGGDDPTGDRPAPRVTALLQNEPNPFNPATTIRFALAHDTRVRLNLYDSRGRRVQALLDESRPAGEHAVVLHADGLASGVYIYQLEADGKVMRRKLVLAK